MQSHEALLILVPCVAPAKRDFLVGKRHEAVIGDGDSVRIAAQVTQGVFGTAKRPFGINDPLLAKDLAEE